MNAKDLNLSLEHDALSANRRAGALTSGKLALLAALTILAQAGLMAGAAYWLLGPAVLSPDALLKQRTEPDTSTQLLQLQSSVELTRVQLNELHLTGQQQISTLQSQVAALEAQLQQVESRPVQIEAAPPAPTPAPAPAWAINLGAQPDAKEARALEQHIQSLGYTTELTARQGGDYALAVVDFSDQHSAEMAAQDLMERADLHGLWVHQTNGD